MPSTIIENVTPAVSNTVKTSAIKSLFSKVKGAPIKSAAAIIGTAVVVTGVVMLVKKLRAPADESVEESVIDATLDSVFENETAATATEAA